jgi:hypothetical protein
MTDMLDLAKKTIDTYFNTNNFYSKNLNPISSEQLRSILSSHGLHKKFPPDFAIFRILDNKAECINKEDITLIEPRANPYEKYITYLIEKYNIVFKNDSHFIFDLASACTNRKLFKDIDNIILSYHFPNISSDLHCIPFTDCHFFHHNYRHYYKSTYQYSETPFCKKINKIIWRGNSCPTIRPDEDMYDPDLYKISGNKEWFNLRLDVCKKYFDNSHMDIGFNKITDAEWKKPYKPFVKDTVDKKSMSEYKYILDICGIGATCEATIWKLQSGSVLFWLVDDIFYKHNLPIWNAWYTPLLKPFEHYIPVNLENMQEMYDWCENHESQCVDICNNAKATTMKILEIWEEANAYILQKISKLDT